MSRRFIEIWEPRYRDLTVLVAPRHLPTEGNAFIEITKGEYQGKYSVSEEDYTKAPLEKIKANKGEKILTMKVIPLGALVKCGNFQEVA